MASPRSSSTIVKAGSSPGLFTEGKEHGLYPIEAELAAATGVSFVAFMGMSCRPQKWLRIRFKPCIDCPGDEITPIPFRKVAVLIGVIDLSFIDAAKLPAGVDRNRKIYIVIPTAPQYWAGDESISTYFHVTSLALDFAVTGRAGSGDPSEDTATKLARESMCFAEELVAKMAPCCEEHARWMMEPRQDA